MVRDKTNKDTVEEIEEELEGEDTTITTEETGLTMWMPNAPAGTPLNTDPIDLYDGVVINGNVYRQTYPNDYHQSRSGVRKYRGKEEYIILPKDGHGSNSRFSPYGRMLEDNDSVKGVAGNNDGSITNMDYMFSGFKGKTLDLTGLNTTGVISMMYMFSNCEALDLRINRFDTSSVINMSGMFLNSSALVLDLRNFDTSKVAGTYVGAAYMDGMRAMFDRAKAKYIDVRSFDVRNVKDMGSMFSDTKTEKIELKNFYTEKCGRFGWMFSGARAKEIDLGSGFHLYEVYSTNYSDGRYSDMSKMFEDTEATKITGLNGFQFENSYAREGRIVGNYSYRLQWERNNVRLDMFRGSKVKELDLSSFNFYGTWIDSLFGRPRAKLGRFFTDSEVEKAIVEKVRPYKHSTSVPKHTKLTTSGGLGYVEPYLERQPIQPINPGHALSHFDEFESAPEVIPFQTVRRINRDMADGEEVVIREGESGGKETKYIEYELTNGETGRHVLEERIIKQPVNEVIEYGTLLDVEKEIVDEVYEYEIERRKDYTKESSPRPTVWVDENGYSHPGKDGFLKEEWEIRTHSDGHIDRKLISREKEQPEPRILVVGMIEKSYTDRVETVIPHETKTTYNYKKSHDPDDTEPKGGSDGKKVEVYEVTEYVDDTETLRILDESKTTIKEPETATLDIGMIDYTKREKESKNIEFPVIHEYTKNLVEGEEELKQQGIQGIEERNYDITYYIKHPATGVQREPLKVERREDYKYEEPVEHIILIGVGEAVESIEDFEVEKLIRYETEYIDDASMYEGQEVVEREGKDGLSIEKYQVITYIDGTTERTESVFVETPMIPKMVRRGTKDPVVSSKEVEEVETVKHETVRVYTNDLLPGETKVIQKGNDGKVVRTYLIETLWNDEVRKKLINTEYIDMVNEVINVGTDREILSSEEETEIELLEFETVYKETNELYEGETKISQEGKDGKIIYTYIVVVFKDDIENPIKTLISRSYQEPINQIILVGTRKRTIQGEIEGVEGLNRNMNGSWLYLEDGDTAIRATVKTKIRPKWGYL